MEDWWAPLEDVNIQIIPAANKSAPKRRTKKSLLTSLEMHSKRKGEITLPNVILSLLVFFYLRSTFSTNKSQSAKTKEAQSRRLWNDIHAAAEAVAM